MITPSWWRVRSWQIAVVCVAVSGAAPAGLFAQATADGSQPAAQGTSAGLNEPIVAQARQMLADFPKSSYSHTTRIDRERGVCEIDCSGFVAAVLRAVSPEHVQALPLAKAGRKRPLAEDFYAGFVTAAQGRLPGWQAVMHVEQARAGDLIAWWHEEHQKGENTGHVMIIAEPPALEQAGRWRIRVFDSTASPHGSDTRPEGTTGLGSGNVWLDVDASGRILGYRWKSAGGKLHEHRVAIGRAI